jgi:SAM-dependent methyltransferase
MSEPDHEHVRRYYDNEYHGHQLTHETGKVPWHMRIIADRLGDLEAKAVLDIACGTGEWLAELQGRRARVAGVDISANAIAQCRQRLPAADLHEGVAEDLPFADARFDLVSCLGSLEHFLDQGKALAEMRRVARPDARFLILVPNAGFLTRRLGLYGGTQQTAIKEDVKSLADWESLFSRAGLRVEHRWRDLHTLSRRWIRHGPWPAWPLRLAQSLALPLWPLAWQYQVYFYCTADSARKPGNLTDRLA